MYQEKNKSMNKRNNWEQLLRQANEELNPQGYEIRISEIEDGCYNCEIFKDKVYVETYAENYFEDELATLVTDAWHYVATKKYSKSAKQMVAEQIIGMLENNVLQECGMESFIGWVEDGSTFSDTYDGEKTEEEINEAIELAKEIASIVDELSWKLNINPIE